MTAPAREQFANEAADVLNGAIDASQTSITVVDGSEFPSSGNFRVRIENEILICTARSTNTLTVQRGQEGTTGASHSDSSVVTHILTSNSFAQHGKDNVPLWGYSSLPPLNKIVADDGSTILTASDFTWRNQGSSTVADQGGTIRLRVPANAAAENVRILERTAPSAPYSYIAAFRTVLPPENVADIPSFGMGFLESGTGEFIILAITTDSGGGPKYAVYNFNSATSLNSTAVSRRFVNVIGSEIWLKIEDNNTNLIFYIGDGVEWIQVYSVGRTALMAGGPDRVFWGFNNVGNDIEAFVRLCHWSRAS